MKNPLYITFLWHMHQPYYKDPYLNKFILPWVRLHSVKDYYNMLDIALKNNIKLTFNLTPSLILQLEEYKKGVKDIFYELSYKDAKSLSEDERIFILKNFFLISWENYIYPDTRYNFLLKKRGEKINESKLKNLHKNFSNDEIRDIQTLFNLKWINKSFYNVFPELKKLSKKGRDFTEEEKIFVLNVHLKIMDMIIPLYKKALKEKKIEISTTPFYHPILPLIYDTDIAKISLADINLDFRFSYPEDANFHIKRAKDYMKEIFNYDIKGFWPSEGSVSKDVLNLFIKNSVEWVATDEEILKKTLKINDDNCKYKLYCFGEKNNNLKIFFRDHYLSDLIGFTYQKWNYKKAVSHFMFELKKIKDNKGEIVPIILDGENAWEYYENNGEDFLNELYKSLTNDKDLKILTMEEAIKEIETKQYLDSIYPGSWINSNFYIWIGHEEDRKAWKLLKTAREVIDNSNVSEEKKRQAMEYIYIAEGSDWTWWYGDDHFSDNDVEFDMLFRKNLMKVYEILDIDIPENLQMPIKKKKISFFKKPLQFISPIIDGCITHFFEWKGAGEILPSLTGTTMHKTSSIIKSLYYGFDLENLYIRIDFFKKENNLKIKLILEDKKNLLVNLDTKQMIGKNIDTGKIFFDYKDIFEIKIPIYYINNGFLVEIYKNIEFIEKIPEIDKINLDRDKFLIYNWQV